VIGVDPEASGVTIDTHGNGTALITLGGLNGAKRQLFTLSPARLARLRRLVAHAKLVDTRFGNPNHYTCWVTTGGTAWRMSQGRVPAPTRRLIGELDALTGAYAGY
jgi:hypothetical protein